MADDAELVARAQQGDREAFSELVQRYVRLAGSVAYGVTGDFHTARDVVQDAFLKVHRSLEGLKEPARFKGWLYGVVRSAAIDHLRRERVRPAVASALEGEDAPLHDRDASDPVSEAQRGELKERVRREVEGLPESYREIVVLKYMDGASYEEIAQVTGLSVEAVESRLHRARKQLRGKLKDLGRG